SDAKNLAERLSGDTPGPSDPDGLKHLLGTRQHTEQLAVDEQEFSPNLDVAEEPGPDEGVQPRRRGLTGDATPVCHGVDTAVGLFEEDREKLCVPSTRSGTTSS